MTTYADTHFEIDGDTAPCCLDFPSIHLHFNYEKARAGDRLSCPECGQVYELRESGGISPELQWCRVTD